MKIIKCNIDFHLYPKQESLLDSQAREILYGGAAGGGKSHVTRIALILWCLQIPGLQCYIFRREFADLIKNHIEGPTGFHALLHPLVSQKQVRIVEKEIRFTNGSKIYLCNCQHEKDIYGYQGAEMHVLAVEEATQFTEFMIRYLRTRVRMPKEFIMTMPEHLRALFPRILYTSNPGGVGHAYFKRAFVNNHIPLNIHIAPTNDGGYTRQYIPARLDDNPSLDKEEYARTLSGVSEEYRKALLEGDWSAIVGSFYPEFNYERHVVPEFIPPPHWFRFRSFDWGSAAPFCVQWWAVSDGNVVACNGENILMPRGALYCYREWYGCDEEHPSRGIAMRNEDMAYGILARSPALEEKNIITVTDSLPFQDRGGKRITDTFLECGVSLIEGDTSRIPGHSQVRSRLIGGDRGAMIYFAHTCVHLIRTIQLLQHDPKKPEEHLDGEDHAVDPTRLAAMSRPLVIDAPGKDFDPRTLTNEMTFNDALKQIKHVKEMRNGNLY